MEWLGCRSTKGAVVGQQMDTVLVVDDNPDLLEVLTEVLQTLGRVCVHTARSGLEALSLYESIDPALVILDEGLTDMRGSELLRQLRQINSHARRPALFVTGSLSSVECQPGDVVLEKPVGMQRFLDAVAALVPEAKTA
jgi:CheY-like chemotaxis protein